MILVTGSNHSGTTWLGKILAASNKFIEVFEPFNNLLYFPKALGTNPIPRHYHYILETEEAAVKRYFKRKVLYSAWSGTSPYTGDNHKNISNQPLTNFYETSNNIFGLITNTKHILVKDPIALLSADWIAREYLAQVIVMIRHPAAYVSSIKRLNWSMSLQSFLSQGSFMATLPTGLVNEIEFYAERETTFNGKFNLVETAISWKVFHYVIYRYHKLHPSWLFLRHEDLCDRTMDRVLELYDKLSLPWDEVVQTTIKKYVSKADSSLQVSEIHNFRRNSSSIPKEWKSKLSQDEIGCIRSLTEDVSQFFYDAKSWE